MKIGTLVRQHPFTAILTSFILGILLTSTISYAIAQVANTTYYACEKTSTGSLRMVAANTTCNSNETLITWNQTGPQGPQGIQGVQGPTGPQGPQGPAGTPGGFGLPFTCSFCRLTPFANTFQGKDFSNAQIVESNFSNADLHGVIFQGAWLARTDFSNANLTGANLSHLVYANPGDTNTDLISGSNPPGVNITFYGSNLTNTDLSNDSFNGPFNPFTNIGTFIIANLEGANFTNTNFYGENLQGALNGSTAIFTGTTWSNTICPDGTNSDNDGHTCINNLTPVIPTPTPTFTP